MSFDTDELVAEWVTRIAHQARHKLDPAGIAAWQNALRGLTPARLELAFQDHFEIASPSIGMPSVREIKAHVARQITPAPTPTEPRRIPATSEKRFLDTAQDFVERVRYPNDWSNLPIDATEADVDAQLRRYADAAVAYWLQRGIRGEAVDAAWIHRENYAEWRDAVATRRQRQKEREELAKLQREKAEAKMQAQRELAARRKPVAVSAPVLPDGRVVSETFDPENPDDCPF